MSRWRNRLRISGRYFRPGPVHAAGPPVWADLYSTLFDGINESADCGDNPALRFANGNPFSIVLWFKMPLDGPLCRAFLSKRTMIPPANRGYEICFGGLNNRFVFSLCAVDNTDELEVMHTQLPGEFDDNNWHWMAWTYDGSSTPAGVYLAIDGLGRPLVTLNNSLVTSILDPVPFNIGCRGQDPAGPRPGIRFFEGNLDEIGIYNKQLSLPELWAIWNGHNPIDQQTLPTVANLVAYWWMGDSDTFPTIADHAGTADGAMNNMEPGDFVLDSPP